MIDALETDRLVLHDFRRVIARAVNIGITEHEEAARFRIRDEMQRRLQDGDAGAFAPDERAGDIETLSRAAAPADCNRKRAAGYREIFRE